jgi:hypothetical protein
MLVMLEQLIYLNVQNMMKYSFKSESVVFLRSSAGKKIFFAQTESGENKPGLIKLPAEFDGSIKIFRIVFFGIIHSQRISGNFA